MAGNYILKLENVTKYYHKGGNTAIGLNNVSLDLKIGEFVAITGESGSGKSTLLNVISGNDTFEEGEMYFNGNNTSHFLEKDWEEYRNNNVSFIFQKYNIVKGLTVYENIELALIFSDYQGDYNKKIEELLKEVDLLEFKKSRANELSGGQKQRVVIARALASGSPIIAADEPTGNLDSKSSEDVIKLLHKLSKDKLVIIVTHDYAEVKQYASRKITVNDGVIVENKVIRDSPSSKIKIKEGTPKVRRKKLIKIACRMQIVYPRRFIFVSLISFVFLVFASYFTNGVLTIESTYTPTKNYYDMSYSYNTPSNIYLGGNSDKVLVDDDYIYFNELVSKDVAYTKYPYYLPLNYDISLGYEGKKVSSASFLKLGSSIKNNIIDGKEIHGRVPSESNEILIPLGMMGNNVFGSNDEVIGKELELTDYKVINNEKYLSYSVIVVGYYEVEIDLSHPIYVDSSFIANRDTLIEEFIDVDDIAAERIYVDSMQLMGFDLNGIYSELYKSDFPQFNEATTYYIDDDLLDYQLSISSSIAKSVGCNRLEPGISFTEETCYDFVLNSDIIPIYGGISTLYKDVGVYSVVEIIEGGEKEVTLNTNTYNQLFKLKSGQAGFITSSDSVTNELEKQLYSSGYEEGYFSYQFDYFSYSFAMLMVAIQIIFNLIVLFLIVILFSSIINALSKTKKEDYILLRSNGSSKKNLTKVAFLEVMIHLLLVLTIYTIILVLYNLETFSGTTNLVLTALFSHVDIESFIVIVAIVLATDLYTTRKFIKKVYKDSIAFGLSRGQD